MGKNKLYRKSNLDFHSNFLIKENILIYILLDTLQTKVCFIKLIKLKFKEFFNKNIK